MSTDLESLALTVVVALEGRWLATAESITGGQIGAIVTSVPGASQVYRGGVVSYGTDVKAELLGVPRELLARGAVQADVALAMAHGAANRLRADFGLAVTGVAGPASQDGMAPGTVFVACVQIGPDGDVVASEVEELHLHPEVEDAGESRAQVRSETVAAALELLLTFL